MPWIEHTVQAVEPPVRTPGQRVGQLVRVGTPEAGENHFAAVLLPVLLAQEEKVRRVEHPDAAVADRHARGNVQAIGKDRHFVSAAIRVRVFENLYPVTTYA